VSNLKAWYAYQLEYLFDLALIKLSVLSFYLVFTTRKAFRFAIYVVMAAVGGFSVAMIIVNAFECHHPSDAFNLEEFYESHTACRDLHPVYFAQAGFNLLSDMALLVLPMPTLLSLRMNHNKRIAVLSIFSIGLIAVAASAGRVYALYLWTIHSDSSFVSAYILIWSHVELNTGICTASIPTLKPLFKKNLFESTKGSLCGSHDARPSSHIDFERLITTGGCGANPIVPAVRFPEPAAVANRSKPRNELSMSFHSRAYHYQDQHGDEGPVSRAYSDVRNKSHGMASRARANNISELGLQITKSVTIERKSTLVPEKIGLAL
jgi:hypothetical protein